MLTDYLAQQLGNRIHDFMKSTKCQYLTIDCSISRAIKVEIFTSEKLLKQLALFGISYQRRGRTDVSEVNFICVSMTFKSGVTVESGRIVNELCPISRGMYDKVYEDKYKEKRGEST